MIHYKAFLHEIRYIIDTQYYFYQIKLEGKINGIWELHGYSDADYTRDNNNRKSTTGYIFLIKRLVIAWCLWSQKKVTLSVIEYKYSAITEICCGIIFIHAILLFMGVLFRKTPLSYTLITLDIYYYWRTHHHQNGKCP